MTGELKIRGVNALRIFDEAFGLIFRRSEECLHLIPTSEGQGENGDIGPLRPFAINLRTGEISMSHKVSVGGGSQVNGALGIGVQNALGGNSIAFGDNDTGLKQNGDGILDVYANNQHVLRFQSDSIQSNKAVNVTGRVTPSDYANFDVRYKQRTEGVEDIRLGGQRVDGHYDDDFTVPSGYVVVGGDVHPSTSLKLYSRPLQKLINGTWYNAASV
ncbi:TPA: phage tail protein [Escherichia coli]|nr:phage tail protein [Escherichia coli]